MNSQQEQQREEYCQLCFDRGGVKAAVAYDTEFIKLFNVDKTYHKLNFPSPNRLNKPYLT